MKLALIQHDIVWEDPQANFAHLEELLAEAAQTGAQLVLLCEMFSYGFSMDTAKVAEPPGGPSTEFLVAQARKHSFWVGGSLPELAAGSPADALPANTLPTNTLIMAAPDGSLTRYAKIHPFSYGGEADHYRPGDKLASLQVGGPSSNLNSPTPTEANPNSLSVGLSVCYDLRFPYLYWHLAPTTDLFVVVANWPAKRRHHWRSLLVARAIENQAWVAGVNRVGSGDGIDYAGDSLIVNPLGEIVADGDTTGCQPGDSPEMILTAEVTTETSEQTRKRFPFLLDRLPDFGSELIDMWLLEQVQ